jgi:hypothetical protein
VRAWVTPRHPRARISRSTVHLATPMPWLARTELRPELARAHLLYGEWLRRKGRRVDAREQLRTAHDTLAAIGMEAFAERARQELIATGETVRKRTADSVAKLTAQEAHIAQLARDGCTNPEIGAQLFLSARTARFACLPRLSGTRWPGRTRYVPERASHCGQSRSACP